jgi:hypothetical protein
MAVEEVDESGRCCCCWWWCRYGAVSWWRWWTAVSGRRDKMEKDGGARAMAGCGRDWGPSTLTILPLLLPVVVVVLGVLGSEASSRSESSVSLTAFAASRCWTQNSITIALLLLKN